MDAKTTLIIITIFTTVGLTMTGSARQVFAPSISLRVINESTHIADIAVFQAHTDISHEQSVVKADISHEQSVVKAAEGSTTSISHEGKGGQHNHPPTQTLNKFVEGLGGLAFAN